MTLTAIDVDRLLDEADSGDAAAQAKIEESIVDLEGARHRSLEAAADGERVAADENESQLIRSQAAMAAYYARGHAGSTGRKPPYCASVRTRGVTRSATDSLLGYLRSLPA